MEFTKNKKVVFRYKRNPIFKVGTIISTSTVAFKDVYVIKGEDNVLYYDVTTDPSDDNYIDDKLTIKILKDDVVIPENEEDEQVISEQVEEEPMEDDYPTFTNVNDDDESNMNLYE